MKHYKDRPFIILGNIIIEYALIILAYIFAGKVREVIGPYMRRGFGLYDMWHYIQLAYIMALIVIFVHLVWGDYQTIHYRSVGYMLWHVCLSHVIAIVSGFAILFSMRGTQLSRAFLGIFLIVSVIIVSGKRVLFHVLADLYVLQKEHTYRVIVVGEGELAKRCYRDLISNQMKRYSYIGYVGEHVNSKMTEYLGNYESLPNILREHNASIVFIAQDQMERTLLNKVLSCCNLYGIPVRVVPVFNDFLLNNRPDISPSGLLFYELNAVKTSDILGVRIAITNMDKSVQEITDKLDDWSGRYICISNVHTTVMAYENQNYRQVQNGAVMALPDGGPLSTYSRSRGNEEAKRVTGPDLMREILTQSEEHGWKHFFYGSRPETLDKLKEVIEERYPGAQIVGMASPPFRELTPEEDEGYVRMINEAKPDFIWVGLGAPKQEIWMAAHENRVHGLMIGVGAAFDYESGNIKRAPAWMQKCNLEWLYRLMQDPRRLMKRYLITNIKYMWLTRR